MKNAFDNRQSMTDENGNIVRFITDPLDEQYLFPPGDAVPEGMLPPQEFEVRVALVEMKWSTERLLGFGLWKRFFKSAEYEKARKLAEDKQRTLFDLVNSSREHKAAIRRIVKAMPSESGGPTVLARYVK